MPNTTYPNYETKFSTSPVENKLNTDAQMDLYKRDEENQKAPKVLPFELEQNAKQMLGDLTIKLIDFQEKDAGELKFKDILIYQKNSVTLSFESLIKQKLSFIK
jgi:hypothetical protein